jgi:hypothetical protein
MAGATHCPHCSEALCDLPCSLDSVPDCCYTGSIIADDHLCHSCVSKPLCCAESFDTIDFEEIVVDYTKPPYSLINIANGFGQDKFPSTKHCSAESFECGTCSQGTSVPDVASKGGCCFKTLSGVFAEPSPKRLL